MDAKSKLLAQAEALEQCFDDAGKAGLQSPAMRHFMACRAHELRAQASALVENQEEAVEGVKTAKRTTKFGTTCASTEEPDMELTREKIVEIQSAAEDSMDTSGDLGVPWQIRAGDRDRFKKLATPESVHALATLALSASEARRLLGEALNHLPTLEATELYSQIADFLSQGQKS